MPVRLICPDRPTAKCLGSNDATPVTEADAIRLSIVAMFPDVVTVCEEPPETTV